MTWSISSADYTFFYTAMATTFVFSALNFSILLFITAPYGKHFRSGWGPAIPTPIAWFLMENPTLWLPILLVPIGRHYSNPSALLIVSLFFLHYIHRTLIYPLRIRHSRTSKSTIPISIIASAFGFNLLNSYIQMRSATHYADYSGRAWTCGIWTAARLGIGLCIFFWGMAVNIRSDLMLIRMKMEGGEGYMMPKGGWFEMVSCPNYMGEVVEWVGWSLMAWSPAATGFLLFTTGNLVARARSHHRWYLEKFLEDYPPSRKAIVPYIY